MSDYREVNKNISKLESMIPGIFDFGKPDWKAIWIQIRVTGKSFKGTRFPSKEEHQNAWDKFQNLVDKVNPRPKLEPAHARPRRKKGGPRLI